MRAAVSPSSSHSVSYSSSSSLGHETVTAAAPQCHYQSIPAPPSFYFIDITWNSFAFDGFGNDGGGLMACVAQSLAELLHTVSIHDDSVPSNRNTHTQLCMLHEALCVCDCSGRDKVMNDHHLLYLVIHVHYISNSLSSKTSISLFLSFFLYLHTQKLHSVSDISPRSAAGARNRFGPDG